MFFMCNEMKCYIFCALLVNLMVYAGSTTNDSTVNNDTANTTQPNNCGHTMDDTFPVQNRSLYDVVTKLECILQSYCKTHIINIVINYHHHHKVKIIEVKREVNSMMITFTDALYPVAIPLYFMNCTEYYSSYQIRAINQDIVNESMIFSLLEYSKWNEIAVLHDMESVSIVTEVAAKLAKQDVYTTLYNIDMYNKEELKSVLTNLNTDLVGGALNISLICDNDSILTILKMAHDFHNKYVHGQMRIQHISKWIIFSYSDFEPKELNLINLDNIVFVNLKAGSINTVDVKPCNKNKTKWFSVSTLMWRPGATREFSKIGNVSMYGDISITSKMYPNADYGFNSRMLKVTTIEWGGMTIIKDEGNFTGLCFDVLNEIARRLNFTYVLTPEVRKFDFADSILEDKIREIRRKCSDLYEVIIPDDGAFGAELPNGSWTGMVGLIQREQVDLVASSLTINPQRERVLDFTYPLVFDHMTVVFAKPGVHKWRTLIDPFQTLVIGLIGISLLVVSLIFCAIERWNPEKREESSSPPPNFSSSFWYLYGALLAQGGVTLPTSLAGRTIISSWWIFCIVSIAVYSGNLTAAFTVNKQRLPFTNLEEMVKQKEYKWGLLGNSVYETVFKESNVATYKEVWNGIVKFNQSDPGVLSESGLDHLHKVTLGKYALIMGKQYIDYEAADNCNLIVLDEKIAQNQVAFAMGNHSPFIRIVSDEILSLHEVGLLEKWKTERWPQKSCDSQEFETRMISVEDIQSAFYMIAIGIVLSTIVLISEKVIWKFKLSCRMRSSLS